MRRRFLSIFLPIALSALSVFAVDRDAAIDELLTRKKLPRVLNTVDVPYLKPTDPQPLFAPEGDFNRDGVGDVAISGVYDLATGLKYFLLIATMDQSATHHRKLFYADYDKPVFIHEPGTTGDADPGDQAFSISFCANCDQGLDFYWNRTANKFETKPWTARLVLMRRPAPPAAIPQETADAALKIVGALPDVKSFVAELKKRKGALSVTVDRMVHPNIYEVHIAEKKAAGKVEYDAITVDLKKKTVIGREKLPLGKGS